MLNPKKSPAQEKPRARTACFKTSDESFWKMRQGWQNLALVGSPPNIFRTFEFCWTWWKHIGSRDPAYSLSIIAVQQRNTIVAIAPLVLRTGKRKGLTQRRLEFLGGEEWSDYHDFLLGQDAEQNLHAILSFLAREKKNWDVLQVENLWAEGQLARSLQTAAPEVGIHWHQFRADICYFLPIDSDFKTWLSRRSPSSRKTFNTKLNRLRTLEQEGLKTTVTQAPHDLPHLAKRMADLEAQKSERGFNLVIGRAESFFDELFQTLGPPGWIYVATAERDGCLIAYQLGFCCGDRLWDYAMAHHPDYAYYSPGLLLISQILQYGFENGFREYDFLRGDEAYKRRWTESFRENTSLLFRSFTLTSRLFFRYHSQARRKAGRD
jgi:CelD/BcsL family acetyltransferase involved in cellulose biosynthesis